MRQVAATALWEVRHDAVRRRPPALVSLYDMLRVQVHELIRAVMDMPAWTGTDAPFTPKPGGPRIHQELRRITLELFVATRLKGLELENTEGLVEEMITRLGPDWPTVNKADWDQFVAEFSGSLRRETEKRIYLYLPKDKQPYYVEESTEASYPSVEIALAFPGASFDLIHAGRCYACEEPTAAVFHAMRALEVLIRLIAKRVRIKLAKKGKALEYQELGVLLAAIQSKVSGTPTKKGIRAKKRGPVKESMLRFYQGAALQLERAIDLWRHPVAHSRTRYGTDEARRSIQATHDLLAHLAANGMKEPR